MKLLLAIRSLLFYLGYASSLIFHASICLLLGPFMSVRRRYDFFLWWNHFVLWWLFLSCGIRVEVTGRENIPDSPYVVLSNHQSTWETLYFYILFKPICAILKKELLRIPFFGWGLRLLQPIAIDRSKRREARQQLMNQGNERIAKGYSVLVFPESTRVDPGQSKAFSNGGTDLALLAGTPIIPVAHNAGVYWPGRRFLKYPGTIRVVVGRPVNTENKSAREITREVETWVRQASS